MKKFTESIEFDKKKTKNLSTDIENLDDQLSDEVKGTKLQGEWEIISIVDVSTEMPDINEAIIVNAELGSGEIKRGDFIYITAQIKKPGQSQAYFHSQMGVLKVRIVDIFHTMSILNNLK